MVCCKLRSFFRDHGGQSLEAIGYIVDGSKCKIPPTIVRLVPEVYFSPKTLSDFVPFVPSNCLGSCGTGLGDSYGVYFLATFGFLLRSEVSRGNFFCRILVEDI